MVSGASTSGCVARGDWMGVWQGYGGDLTVLEQLKAFNPEITVTVLCSTDANEDSKRPR